MELLIYFLLVVAAYGLIGYGHWWGKGQKHRDRDDDGGGYGDDAGGTAG